MTIPTRLNDNFVAAVAEHSITDRSAPLRTGSAVMHRFLTFTMLACFAVAGWLGLRTPALDAAPNRPASIRESLATTLRTVPIEQVRLGQRVTGRNPLREQTQTPSDITPDNWRAIRLTMHAFGVQYDLAFLRSLDWLEATGATPGREIHLTLPEMGLDGPALVGSIAPCPPLEPDDGPRHGEPARMLVTGTMRHLAGNILDVSITGLDEPLGVTDTHPIWSETRQNFVVAGQLEVGEHLRSETGTLAQVTRITPRRGPPEFTYNLEIDGEHVYEVGAEGLLVHNSCMTPDQIALKELVEEASLGGRKALDADTANTILDWAAEVKYPTQGRSTLASAADLATSGNHWVKGPHIHIPYVGSGHIPVLPGVTPR